MLNDSIYEDGYCYETELDGYDSIMGILSEY